MSSNGRMFYILDEGATASVILPSRWKLIARDAFSGMVLWKKDIPDWQTRLWPLKSGPAQLPRRLVAGDDMVFATLGINEPVTAVDAQSGKTLRTYEQTRGTEEILYADGVLYVVVNPTMNVEKYTNRRAVDKPWWTGEPVKVMAVEAESGRTLWRHSSPVVPLTLAVAGESVFFYDGEHVVAVNAQSGSRRWQSEPLPMVKRLMSFFAPTLVARAGVVLFAGGEESGLVKSSGGATKSDTITALDAESGETLWDASHPPSGYSSPEDVLVLDGTVWYGGVSNGRMPGAFTGRDIRTGKVRASYESAGIDTYWFHHRCYRGKATDRFLMMSRTGIEFIDPDTGKWNINHWVRGGCLYGVMPANGMLYAPPHACACYPESKLYGFNALKTGSEAPEPTGSRLKRGPAYERVRDRESASSASADWPTYRRDGERRGSTPASMPAALTKSWSTQFSPPLSAVTVAGDTAFVCEIDHHTVQAVDVESGRELWTYTAGGRVDSPPTIYREAAIFGCADGWIYCLDVENGELAWRFRAAPADVRIVSYEQVESRWPVHGSVLVEDGVVYAVAGRSLFLDGGLRLCRLDARSGQLLSEDVLDDTDPESGKDIQTHVQRLTMPVALPDVLSSDGKRLYMRSQVFDMQGKRKRIAPRGAREVGAHAAVQEGSEAHLFAAAGFLDDTWFHRSYWLYGRGFEGGWNSYYLAGRQAPAGKILVLDDTHVYGFGRKMKYYRWTVPLEFQLFASPRDPNAKVEREKEKQQGSIVRVDNSRSLNPAKQPVTVSAWVRAEGDSGVIIARGGGIHGYSLYLQDRKPHFSMCANSKRATAAATEKVGNDWVHLAGVLGEDAELRIYIDGKQVGSDAAPSLIPEDPADSMQIGADENSAVGGYSTALPFRGAIDEVRVYHAELSPAAVQTLAADADSVNVPRDSLVLEYSFDEGEGKDASGNKNHGSVVGAETVPGKVGQALRFVGRVPDAVPVGSRTFAWTRDAPILVRGMAKARDVLFVAGPEDVLDEPEALKTFDAEETQEAIQKQADALAGRRGAILRAVHPDDGETLAETRIEAPPV
ncbi:MAG: PQQ-binding-like beta-propeller repeat protein, partial [Pirellulaceae bacterium]